MDQKLGRWPTDGCPGLGFVFCIWHPGHQTVPGKAKDLLSKCTNDQMVWIVPLRQDTTCENQGWSAHFKTVRTSLNQLLFVIRRIARQIPQDKLINVLHSLWVSKLRYGLQLCTSTRITSDKTRTANEKSLQLTQNRMIRAINGSKISNKISIKSMLA